MRRTIAPFVAALGLLAASAVSAHSADSATGDHSRHATTSSEAAPVATEIASAGRRAPDARAYFTDTELIDQDGRRVRFYSDVMADRVVMFNFIFTSCDDACPLITQAIAAVKDQIPEIFGKPVHFISISVDPVTDTPERLREFAAKNNADMAGWTFLTGDPENVARILKKLGQFSEEREAHSTLLIAGNVPQKRWSKIRPEAPAAAIAERLRALAAAGVQARAAE
ncbi:MAG: SCO family protein [Rhodocyclaceae bacterium]|nr:SCO family protein [Rhodocyclaceae bacterium]